MVNFCIEKTFLLFASGSESSKYKNSRKCVYVDRYLQSNSCFSVTRSLKSSIKVSKENIRLRKGDWYVKFLYLVLASESWQSEIARSAIICDASTLSISCFCPSIVLISSMKSSVETTTLLKWVFGWKWLIYLVPWFRIVIPQVFQFVQLFSVHGEFQTFFLRSYRFSPPKICNRMFPPCREDRPKRQPTGVFFESGYWPFFHFFRYSLTYSFVTRKQCFLDKF